MISPNSKSMPVLAVISMFEIEDGKTKELIYWLAHWTNRNLNDPEVESFLDERVKATIALTHRMVEIGYEPQDPQTLNKKLVENLVRCIPIRDNDDELTAAEVVELEADIKKQKDSGEHLTKESGEIIRLAIARVIWKHSTLNLDGSIEAPNVPAPEEKLESLGLDSLGLVEAQISFEETFKIALPDEALDWETVGQIYEFYEDKILGG